jgi:hypothetical protein
MKESSLLRAILLEAPKLGVTLFRNNVGVLEDVRGNKIRFGLCVGSSDLIGWRNDGRFVAIECKSPGKKPTQEQQDFLWSVRNGHGLSGIAYSIADFRRIIGFA